jgi:hypothetical protein
MRRVHGCGALKFGRGSLLVLAPMRLPILAHSVLLVAACGTSASPGGPAQGASSGVGAGQSSAVTSAQPMQPTQPNGSSSGITSRTSCVRSRGSCQQCRR